MDNYKITADEFEKVSIARMATHPNSSTAYGESKLSAAELKKRFDAQGRLFCKKFNKFLAMIPGGGEGDSLAAHILTGIEEDHTLKDMFADIVAKGGVFASYLSVGDQSLLQKLAALESADLTLAEKLHLLEEEGEAINEQIAALKQADAQIRQEMVDGFDKSVPTKIGAHNAATDSHNDIRLLIEGLTARLNAVANSSDVDLDQLAELVAYIKSNRSLIEEITTSKVNVKDIIDNLTTNVNNKPLSAAQGVILKNLIDAIVVPTKLSELADDADHRTISDAERRKWNAGGSSVLEVIETYTANDNVVISQQSVSSGMWSNRKMDIYPGTVYAVYINGEVYFCTAHEYDGGVYLGNITLMDSSATDPHNNKPFCVYWAGGSATGGFFDKDSTLSNSVTLKVTGAAVTTEYKLPTKYLHDDVARTVDVKEHNESSEAHRDIRSLIGNIKVPTKLSELTDDSTHRTVTDSEKSEWNSKEAAGTAAGAVNTHNTSTDAHNDIRLLIEGLNTRLNAVANSSDVNLDQLAELVAYIKANRSLIEQVTTNKVSVSDIIDNLTTNVSNKPLSAAQGVALKALIDAITVPTKLSQLADDASHRTVTDEEKEKWNVLEEVEAYTANATIVIPQQSLSSGMWMNRKYDIEPGIPYAVYIGGKEYFCIAGNEDGTIYLGNPKLFDSASTQAHNNEPFCITWAGGAATAGMFFKDSTLSYPITLKVTGAAVTTENKLPEKYLPDAVAMKSDIPEGGGGGSASIDVTASVGQTIVVEEVDADGKPTKWKAVEYQERTHWTDGTAETDILPLTTFTPIYNANFGCALYYNLPAFELEEGKTYTVIFDGTNYTCTAFAAAMGAFSGIAIGNPVFAGGENNDVPFGITMANNGGLHMFMGMDTDEHTLRIIGEQPIYNKIPEEYIIKADFAVELSYTDNGYTLLTPWEDIISATRAGKNIYGVVRVTNMEADQYGNLRGFTNSAKYFTCMSMDYSLLTPKCEMGFFCLAGSLVLLNIVRDENGVTTVTATGD